MQANSAAHPEKLYASTPGRSWTQNLEKQMQQSPKSSKPTQQTPNPRPVSKRDKATHHLPLSLLSRQRDISAIKAERKRVSTDDTFRRRMPTSATFTRPSWRLLVNIGMITNTCIENCYGDVPLLHPTADLL